MILRRDTGPDDIQEFSSEAPIWLREFLVDELLKIDLKSHPHLASPVVSILTSNDRPEKAIEALVCLTKKPDNIEYPLRNAIRMTLRRDPGPDDTQKFSSEAPTCLKEFLDSVVSNPVSDRKIDDEVYLSHIIEKTVNKHGCRTNNHEKTRVENVYWMPVEDHYSQLFGTQVPWEISKVNLNMSAHRVDIEIEYTDVTDVCLE